MRVPLGTLARASAWVVALGLVVGAGAYYRAGSSAGELHSRAVRVAADTPTVTPSSGPGTPRVPVRPTEGPGVDAPGTLIAARWLDGDLIDVSETTRSATGIRVVTIDPPQAVGAQPRIVGGQLTADGRVVAIPVSVVAQQVRIALPAPARVVAFRYQLGGAVVRSTPSTLGRAIVRFTPASDVGEETPVVFTFGGTEIIGASCPQLPRDRFVCVRGAPGALRLDAPLTRDTDLVLLQLNVPGP